ncbi:MAG: hypothetical protein ACOY3I_01905 [Verrucomicrobiota bacterium]
MKTIAEAVSKGNWSYAGRLAMIALLLEGTAFVVKASDDSVRIASSDDIPGKGGFTTCEIFAQELYKRLTRAGGESHLIIFEWNNGRQVGKHAAVVFRDAGGSYWCMDNRDRRPRRVDGRSASSWINNRYDDYKVRLISAKTDRRLKGQYASLSRETERPVYVAATEPPRTSRNTAYTTRRSTTAIRIPSPIPKPRARVYVVDIDPFLQWQIDRIQHEWNQQTGAGLFLPSEHEWMKTLKPLSTNTPLENAWRIQLDASLTTSFPSVLSDAKRVSVWDNSNLFSASFMPPLAALPLR